MRILSSNAAAIYSYEMISGQYIEAAMDRVPEMWGRSIDNERKTLHMEGEREREIER